MNKHLIVFLFLINASLVFAQKEYKKKYENGNIEIVGQLDLDGKQIGEWVYYYEDGQVERIEKFVGDKIYAKSYWENGQLSEISNSENGFFFGKMIMYYDNGKLWSVKKFNQGQANGKWKSYHLNGKLYSVECYKNGNRVNKSKIYHENGKIQIFSIYKDGLAIKSKWYHDDGKLWKIETTNVENKENYIESIQEWDYHQNGKIEKVTKYVNGEPKGEWKYYNEDGKLIKSEKF